MRLTQRGRPHRCSEGKVQNPSLRCSWGLCGFLWPSEAVVAMRDVVLPGKRLGSATQVMLDGEYCLRKPMKPPRSKLRGITRKGIVCETPRFLTLFPL